MKNNTLYLPGFHLSTLRRTPRSARQIFAEKIADLKRKTFSQLGECFGQFIPNQHLRPAKWGTLSRRRFYSKENTFWAFFSQVLDADRGCQEVVRTLQAFAAMQSKPLPSSSTAAYGQARKKVEHTSLEAIFQHTSERFQAMSNAGVLNGRRVVVVDGTGIRMPDTVENQQVWPQQSHQKPGCGFPLPVITSQTRW